MAEKIPRNSEERLKMAEALLYPNVWSHEDLKIHARRIWSYMRDNLNGFERTYGEGSYTRLWLAFEYGSWRLEHQNVIHPDDLDIIEAYFAIPRYTGSVQDDGVDFETPRARLRLALAQPLDQTNTPKDPAWKDAA
jgi:hypothetical protein